MSRFVYQLLLGTGWQSRRKLVSWGTPREINKLAVLCPDIDKRKRRNPRLRRTKNLSFAHEQVIINSGHGYWFRGNPLYLCTLDTSKKVVSEFTIQSLNICHIYSLLRKVPLKGMKKET